MGRVPSSTTRRTSWFLALTPGVWTMIEVKTLDVTASTHIQSHHTDRERLAAHAAAIRASAAPSTVLTAPRRCPSSTFAFLFSLHLWVYLLLRPYPLLSPLAPPRRACALRPRPRRHLGRPALASLARMLVGFAARRGRPSTCAVGGALLCPAPTSASAPAPPPPPRRLLPSLRPSSPPPPCTPPRRARRRRALWRVSVCVDRGDWLCNGLRVLCEL